MATTSLKYRKLLRKLLPGGWAWQAKSITDTDFNNLVNALSEEPCRVEAAAFALVDDVYPDASIDLLPDWERVLNLPDECDPDTVQTIAQRQNRVVQVLTTTGGQNAAFFLELAARFGFDPNEIEVNDHVPFRAGQARAGDAITNGDWIFAFTVSAPVSLGNLTYFRAGSKAGDRLLTATNATLECLLQKHKPAHTIVLFSFK
ncbi:MAG: DUF2313 domain-containing protein [Proteobacteria bacterium]|nr:DUF2313 domain-containing protein [Pseudomonadota bacterium]